MEPDTLPRFFAPLRVALANLHAGWSANKLTPLSGCLHCVLRNADIDVAIVGVNRVREFEEIKAAVEQLSNDSDESIVPVTIDPTFLDPRQWPAT